MEHRKKLTIGTEVLFDGEVHIVVGFDGGAVRLKTPKGRTALVAVSHLVSASDFEILDDCDDEGAPKPGLDSAGLDDLPKEVREEAEKRCAHLDEAVTGYPSGNVGEPERIAPRPEYNPVDTSLTQRMAAKATEMGISESRLWSLKRAYEHAGLYGCVDKRRVSPLTAVDHLDPRLREAFLTVLDELTKESNVSHARIIRKVKSRVEKEHGKGAVVLPSDRTLHRILKQLARGRSTFYSAKSRRSIANRPATTYRRFRASRPGEVVLIDTTPLDVFAVDPLTLKWVSLELTLALDLYTRSILAWRLTPRGTKGVDVAQILRDVITPTFYKSGSGGRSALGETILCRRSLGQAHRHRASH